MEFLCNTINIYWQNCDRYVIHTCTFGIPRNRNKIQPLNVSRVQEDIIGMWLNSSELCISDAVGRSHGDVNCESLLVQLLGCRRHTGRNERHILLLSPPSRSNLLSCTAAIQSVKSNPVWLHCIYEELRVSTGMWFDRVSWECIARADGGEGRTREIPANYWEWFFDDLWLVAVRDGMINCAEQELHFLISPLSIYLLFSPWPPLLHRTLIPQPPLSLY